MRVIGLNTEHDFFELGIVANKATVRRIVGVLRPQRKDVVKRGSTNPADTVDKDFVWKSVCV
jgi:hypothetical protein